MLQHCGFRLAMLVLSSPTPARKSILFSHLFPFIFNYFYLIIWYFYNSPGTLIFAQVQHVHEAIKAVVEWKVDALVVQGIESGGHGAVVCFRSFYIFILTYILSLLF
jgi:hypothetical protein